ncbi:putative pectinesterase inhibitor domain-containing protein [Dioscorea sansibarensis]
MNLFYCSFLCILLLSILQQHLAVGFASVEVTCKAAAASNRAVNYDFCVTYFLRHPWSGDVDERGLANIAATMSINTAYNGQYTIQSLLQKKPEQDSATISGLHHCKVLYNRMLTTLAKAVDSINSRQDGVAKNCLKMAISQARSCEEGFIEARKKSPLTQENTESIGLSTVAMTILDLLKHN